MKTCYVCDKEKPFEEFSLHKGMKDGHLNKCKECANVYSKQHRADNPDYYVDFEKQRASTDTRRAQVKGYISAYKGKYPERIAATTLLNNAVRAGNVHPEPCFECGKKAVAHHSDYSQPLLVTWLCQRHHRQLHAEFI